MRKVITMSEAASAKMSAVVCKTGVQETAIKVGAIVERKRSLIIEQEASQQEGINEVIVRKTRSRSHRGKR